MSPVKRVSLADQAAELLAERIRGGEWEVGAKLPGETTLAPQLGVGRSTIREAIRQLAGRGILQTRQGSGVFVSSLAGDEELDLALRRVDIARVIEARLAIESESAALAAARRAPADLRAMREALAARAKALSDIESHVDADLAVHRSIVAAAGNEILLGIFDSFVPRLREAMVDMLRLKGAWGDAADQAVHEALVEAIASGEPDRAREVCRAHLTGIRLD